MGDPTPIGGQFLDSTGAATFLGLRPRTLDRWRWAGKGPRYRRHGGRVMYAIADLTAWSESQARTSTSDSGAMGRDETGSKK